MGTEFLTVDRFERGAGEDVNRREMAHVLDALPQHGIPGPAVFIGQRCAGGHLGFVGCWMEVIAILEHGIELLGKQAADDGFTGAGDSHDDDGAQFGGHVAGDGKQHG